MGGELSLETYVHDDKMRSFESKLNLIEQSKKQLMIIWIMELIFIGQYISTPGH